MEGSEETTAIAASIAIAGSLGLTANEATVVNSSNKLALRLLPCDVFARVAPVAHQHARFEIELAQRLAAASCPVAALEPRVEPRGYVRDGFELTLWTYYEPVTSAVAAPDFAHALELLHAGMRTIDMTTPHFTDRVTEALTAVATTSMLDEGDRELLSSTLRHLGRAITDRGTPEQLLHGEPHPGNVLDTASGPRFIDLETCCRGPVEFDLAHVPETVSKYAAGIDDELLGDCRGLVLTMVAGWRVEPGDQLPHGQLVLRELLRVLRSGPPWPTLDDVFGRSDGS